ncbi:hypothetical protein BO71DRAFT_434339 [Aspergillus ellipticus CBS 707.79]|uniref:Uncharacterized protein n=1 Tax=Aspergillus ellipticus CBS 707.79 TaxID=1448320 RepID=A0A319D5Y6_9EURO|nr:hypothetical protein BO71DRAFT_434339 [Aspergillus ellipticus CBS 707.79]
MPFMYLANAFQTFRALQQAERPLPVAVPTQTTIRLALVAGVDISRLPDRVRDEAVLDAPFSDMRNLSPISRIQGWWLSPCQHVPCQRIVTDTRLDTLQSSPPASARDDRLLGLPSRHWWREASIQLRTFHIPTSGFTLDTPLSGLHPRVTRSLQTTAQLAGSRVTEPRGLLSFRPKAHGTPVMGAEDSHMV